MDNSTFQKFTGPQVKALRKQAKLTQFQFWTRVGISQSGGSRYENGRAIPSDTQLVLMLVYGTSLESKELLAQLRGFTTAKAKRVNHAK